MVKISNPVKLRPQTKCGCRARLNLSTNPDGKWKINRVALEHNHENSPGKAKFHKNYRVLDEHVKRKLLLNDKAGIKTYKTYDSLQIEAGDLRTFHIFPKTAKIIWIKSDINYLLKEMLRQCIAIS
ncbi:hypothetical protein RHGRI_023894 [Rhododendron griersonianum]|uniref:FAR1 domain-containing protein n=1 Tax=Rhododendron griersonianum TaxID=479676 RepID=A0AAV6J8Z8_9ERIC|nr:hypothetical protein RHGRI_023894 [Rhododendron griersonianum]